jgi:hypothetical protein
VPAIALSQPGPSPSPAAASGRDPRLDLLRGFCVLLMLVGHLGWLRLQPHFQVGFATAAEGFFFLSGATLGVVYARYLREGRQRGLYRRLVLRALWLALANTALVVLAYAFEGTPTFPGQFFDGYWRRLPDWLRFASLNQPSVLHILPRYSILLLLSPLVLRALASRAALLVPALSIALWLAHFLEPRDWRLPQIESRRYAAFPLASWQLLFFGGMTLAVLAGRRSRPTRAWPAAGIAAGAAAALGLELWRRAGLPGTDEAARTWITAQSDRATLGLVRLADFALLAAVLWNAADRWREPVARAAGWLLLPLGRNALSAFLLHIPALWLLNLVDWGADTTPLRLAAALAVTVGIARGVTLPGVRRVLAPV